MLSAQSPRMLCRIACIEFYVMNIAFTIILDGFLHSKPLPLPSLFQLKELANKTILPSTTTRPLTRPIATSRTTHSKHAALTWYWL